MHNTDSFISYRRSASMHLARNIFTELNQRKINAFLDVENIDATRFDTFMLNQIAARANYVLILSKGSLQPCTEAGDWLLREIQHAVKLNRNIIPVWDVGFDWEAEKGYLPEELHFIGARNAVKFSDTYYRAFMDRIAQFIRNPQDHGDIRITPAPEAEAKEAQQAIREALLVRFDDASLVEAIGQYHRLKQVAQSSTDWQDLLDLWSQIRASGTFPKFFEFDAEEKSLREALERQKKAEIDAENRRIYEAEREKNYDFIRQLAKNPNIPKTYVVDQVRAFWKLYPKDKPLYDPNDLSAEHAGREQAEKEARIQAENEARIKAENKRIKRLFNPWNPLTYIRFMWWMFFKVDILEKHKESIPPLVLTVSAGFVAGLPFYLLVIAANLGIVLLRPAYNDANTLSIFRGLLLVSPLAIMGLSALLIFFDNNPSDINDVLGTIIFIAILFISNCIFAPVVAGIKVQVSGAIFLVLAISFAVFGGLLVFYGNKTSVFMKYILLVGSMGGAAWAITGSLWGVWVGLVLGVIAGMGSLLGFLIILGENYKENLTRGKILYGIGLAAMIWFSFLGGWQVLP